MLRIRSAVYEGSLSSQIGVWESSPAGSSAEPWPQKHFGEFLVAKMILIVANMQPTNHCIYRMRP